MSDDTIELIRHVNPLPVDLPPPAIEPLLNRLGDQARAGAEDGRRPRRRRFTGGRLAAALSSVVAVGVAVAAIILLAHGRPGPPAVSHMPSAPSSSAQVRPLTSILGILRRAQTVADRNPLLIQELKRQERNKFDLAFNGRPVMSLMRLATRAPWGQRIYVVPFLAPTKRAQRRLPRKDRGATVPDQAALWTFSINNGNGDLGIPAEIQGGRDIAKMAYLDGAKRGPAANRWVMVVPDGVAKVALWETTGSTSQHPRHPTRLGSKPIIVIVHHNIAAFIAHGFHGPGQEIWYGPDGKVLKRIANAGSCGPPLGNCA